MLKFSLGLLLVLGVSVGTLAAENNAACLPMDSVRADTEPVLKNLNRLQEEERLLRLEILSNLEPLFGPDTLRVLLSSTEKIHFWINRTDNLAARRRGLEFVLSRLVDRECPARPTGRCPAEWCKS